MHRRGPDGTGVHAAGPIALGHRRLKIIDLSERGGQPMVDAELGLAAVFNGCIYNYRELRAELEGAGYRFFSTSDTEVLLKAFHRWGAACVERFFGMFAFAVAERDTGVLTLGRDRLGIKPLYLAETPERHPVRQLAARAARGRRRRHLDRPGGAAPLHDVPLGRPRAAHDPRRGAQAPARHRAHDPPRRHRRASTSTGGPSTCAAAQDAGMSARDWRDAVLESLRVAVRRRMVADVPVGVLLSGGLDSSLVVALLADEGQVGLKTFSVGFHATAGESGDEFEYSDLIAEHFGTDHQQILVDPDRHAARRRRRPSPR